MVVLHEATRRMVCRLAFLALCVLPTVGVLAWAAAANLPGKERAAETRLVSLLELAARVEDVSYPRPGVTLYRGVELADPETGRVVARLASLEATDAAGGTLIHATGAEVDGGELHLLWNAVARRLRLQRAAADRPVRFSASHVTVGGKNGGATFAQVSAELTGGGEASRLQLRLSLPEATGKPPLELSIERAAGSAGATRVTLRTGGAPLPLAAIHAVFPALASLGDRAEFVGYLWAREERGEWSGEATGRLAKIDLDALVTRQFPHKLSGEAEFSLGKLAFSAGRVDAMEGRIDAGPGVAGHSLLVAAAQSLGMSPGAALRGRRDEAFEYRQLAASFAIGGDAVGIEGACTEPGGGGCVITSEEGELLRQAAGPQPALGLVRLLVPATDVQAPVSRESAWLLERLPIPAARGTGEPRGTLRDVHGEASERGGRGT